MINAFMFGYYGFDNIGDEMILKSIVDHYKNKIDFDILTYNYNKTINLVDVRPISRSKFNKILTSIIKSDIVIAGGGSLLQDVTSSKSLYFYLGLIFLSKIFGKKVIFLYNGFGPINKPINQKIVQWILNIVDDIIVRDQDSLEFLKQLDVKTKVLLGSDAVFLKDYNMPITNKKESNQVVISIRSWMTYDDQKLSEMVKVIHYLNNEGFEVKLWPLMIPNDLNLLLKLKDQLAVEVEVLKYDDVDQVLATLNGSSFLIGERLHSLIFSSVCELPFIAIEYDPKVKGFTKMFDQINACKTKNISSEKIIGSIDELTQNYNSYSRKMHDNLEKIKERINNVSKYFEQKYL